MEWSVGWVDSGILPMLKRLKDKSEGGRLPVTQTLVVESCSFALLGHSVTVGRSPLACI